MPLFAKFAAICGLLLLSAAGLNAEDAARAETVSAAPTESNHPLLHFVPLDAAKVLPTLKDVTLEKYPDANVVTVAHGLRIDYRADGTYTQVDEHYVKIMTEAGRKANTRLYSFFTIPYQLEEDCKIPLAEIIKPDGKTVSVDVSTAALSIFGSGMDANIYNPNDKMLTLNLPGLEVGDTLHYIMYDNNRHPRAKGIFADYFTLEQFNPLLRMEITVNGVKELPLRKIALRNEIPGTVKAQTSTRADGGPVYRWEVTNVPQAISEPDMPSLSDCGQRLLISTAADWQEVSAWYARICTPALAAVSHEMRAEVEKIVADAATPMQKIEKIFTWVSQQIRYMGVTTEKNAPGYEPHPVKDTFAARHGVCRDKAALLVAMLRLAGVEAYPVLIHTRAKKDAEVAQPFFNHAVTAAKVDGKIVLMDATDESTRDLFPPYLNDKSYLLATENGDPLRTSPVTPASANTMTIETSGDLDAHGNLTAETVIKYAGLSDNIFRGHFANITPEDRRRYFEGTVKKLYGEACLVSWKLIPENPQDTTQPLRAELRFTAPKILNQGNGLTLLPLPFINFKSNIIDHIIGSTGLDKRRFPLRTGNTFGLCENIKINLPENLDKEVSMPVYKPIDNQNFSWKLSLARVGKALLGKNEMALTTVEFSPADYLQLKEDLKNIEYARQKMPVFLQNDTADAEPLATRQADSLVVRDDTEIEVLDGHSWRERQIVRRKILTYSGMKKHSEIQIYYNPAFESVKLESASVISPSGKTQNIGEHEINIMDQDWNGGAPRYPGGKIFVASLPGVEVGSSIETRILREFRGQPFFYHHNCFRGPDPVSRRTVTLRGKDFQKIAAHATQNVNYEETVDGARVWSADNQPLVKNEDDMPPWSSHTPALFLSGAESWKAYAQYVREKIAAAAANQPQSAARATQALNGKLTLAGVREIADWLDKKIELRGPDFGDLPLDYLSPADRTLADGYGNSVDRAVLLFALFAPYQPELFLVTNRPHAAHLPEPNLKLPGAYWFNHVLLRLKVEGRTVWMNDISQYHELGTTPSEGMTALNLQTGALETVTVDPAFRRADEYRYAVELQPDGAAVIRVTEIASGSRYGALKKLFTEMRPEKRRQYFLNELAKLSKAAEAGSDFITDFSAYPGKVAFTAKVKRYAVEDGGFVYLSLPRTLADLFTFRSSVRENPLFLRHGKHQKISTAIVLPPDTLPMLTPGRYTWQSPVGSGTVEIETLHAVNVGEGKNILQISQTADLQPEYYVPALYPELLKAQGRLCHNRARTIVLANKKWLELQRLSGSVQVK